MADPPKQATERATKVATRRPEAPVAVLEPSVLDDPGLALPAQYGMLDTGRAQPADVLALQRGYGNQAVSGMIQAKLTVGPAGDRYEREADRVAEQVLAMPPTRSPDSGTTGVHSTARRQPEEEEEALQGKPLAATVTPLIRRQEEEEELQGKREARPLQRQEEEELQGKREARHLQRQEEEELQGKPEAGALERQSGGGFEADPAVADRLSARKGGGQPLPGDVRGYMEPRFGSDFSGVRVHSDPEAGRLSRDLSAQAFTHGQDIYMGAGHYDPGSTAGKRLLAHELTHVVQQTGRGQPPVQPQRLQAEIVQRNDGQGVEPEKPVTPPPLPPRPAPPLPPRPAPPLPPRRPAAGLPQKPSSPPPRPPAAGLPQKPLGPPPQPPAAGLPQKPLGPPPRPPAAGLPPMPTTSAPAPWQKGSLLGQAIAGVEGGETLGAHRRKAKTTAKFAGAAAWGPIGAAGGVADRLDQELVNQWRVLTAEAERIGKEQAQAAGVSLEQLMEQQGYEEISDFLPADKQTKLENLGTAEAAAWAGAGILGMATSLKDFAEALSSEKAWDKAWKLAIASVGAAGSTAGAVGGISSLVGTETGSAVATAALPIQEGLGAVSSLLKTAKGAVELIKMGVEQARGKVQHTKREAVEAVASIIQSALETLKGAAKTALAINEAWGGGGVTSAVSQTASAVALGADIAIAGCKTVFQGYELGLNAWQWHLMSKRKKELKGELATKGFGKEKVKEARKGYRHGEAMKATLADLIAKNEATIKEKQKQLAKPATGWRSHLPTSKSPDKLKTEITKLQQDNEKYKAQLDEHEKGMLEMEAVREGPALPDVSGGQKSVPGLPTRKDLEELDLAGELGATSQKRVARQAAHIIANMVQIAGSIATFVSGPGAPAAIAIKLSAAGIEAGMPLRRMIAQFGKNYQAKKAATGGKVGFVGKHLFDADKSTAAKEESRKRQARTILKMVADLNSGDPLTIKAQADRVEGYIRATGCDPKKLYAKNGHPMEQVKILVGELSRREFGGE